MADIRQLHLRLGTAMQWWNIVSAKCPELRADHYSSVTTLVLDKVQIVVLWSMRKYAGGVCCNEQHMKRKKDVRTLMYWTRIPPRTRRVDQSVQQLGSRDDVYHTYISIPGTYLYQDCVFLGPSNHTKGLEAIKVSRKLSTSHIPEHIPPSEQMESVFLFMER